MPSKELTTVVPDPSKDGTVQVEVTLPVRQRRREASQNGDLARVSTPVGQPQISRIARLMALAIKFQDLVDRGEVRDYSDLARLGYVTRARMTQIMNLRHLAPDIQERLLDADVRNSILAFTERELRLVSRTVQWVEQREILRRIPQSPRP